MRTTFKKPGDYGCAACGDVLGEPFFCAEPVQRLGAAFAFVGEAIGAIAKLGIERARREYGGVL